jgi:hypothetical protein
MFKLRIVALAATFLLALTATVVASAPASASDDGGTPPSACNVNGLWGGIFEGALPGDQGAVFFEIFDQQPAGDDDGDDNGGDDGDDDGGASFSFRWRTTFVSNGATAQGTGELHVSPAAASFSISGSGTHPVFGDFSLSAAGTVTCAGGQGTQANGTYEITFDNGLTDQGTVVLVHCLEGTDQELCIQE